MARLIDADALRIKFQTIAVIYHETIEPVKCRPDSAEGAVNLCTQFLDQMPTITAEPKRGRWIENGEICGIDKYKCSICGGEVGGLLDNTKYCCFCGARMDGGNNSG